MRKVPGFVIWLILALAVAIAPVACGGSDGDSTENGADAATAKADAMTAS